MRSTLAEPEDDPGAVPEIILAVVEPIWDLCQEVFGLHWTDRQVFGDFEVNSAAGGHREMALPSYLLDP